MDWKRFLFSFEGRVGRQQYWLMVMFSAPFYIGAWMINGIDKGPAHGPGGLLLLLPIWSVLAVTIKRWHDRDKPGWWILINFIPLIGGIWALVENGFLKGSPGDNRFGEDPLTPKIS